MELKKPIVIVLDNAREQKCKFVQKHAKSVGIQLCYLPCYSPQLSLIEIFCNFLRIEIFLKFIINECFYFKYYANFADFKAVISNCIATANTDKQKKLNSLLTLEFQTSKKKPFFSR
ncbi:MAG: transposase [Richelia sp.]|nr:transposase [Richelia sp.]